MAGSNKLLMQYSSRGVTYLQSVIKTDANWKNVLSTTTYWPNVILVETAAPYFFIIIIIILWARSFNTGTSLDYFSKLRVKSLHHNTTDKHFVSAVALRHRYITKSTINLSEKKWQWRACNECCTVLLGVSIKDSCLYEKQGSTASLSLSANSVSSLSSPCSASPTLPFHHYSHSVLLFLSL